MSSLTLAPAWYDDRPRAAARPRATRGQVRLTRRGRLVVFLACLALVLGTALFLGASSIATDEAGPGVTTERIVVGSGDTLWDLAAERSDNGDVRSMMLQIRELNALEDSMLLAGQELHVPVTD